jgi:hypothetical protein
MHCLVLLLGFVLGKAHVAYQQSSLLGFVLGNQLLALYWQLIGLVVF